MRINKIEMCDFRGIKGPDVFPVELDAAGKNLLLYGENGSGKSTIMLALDRVIRNRTHDTKIDANRFRRPDSETKAFVKVTLSDGMHYTYGYATVTPAPEVVRTLSDAQLRCGFLGYKILLKTSFYSGLAQHTLFRLAVDELLADHRILIDGSPQPLKSVWQMIERSKPRRRRENNVPAYRAKIRAFNDALSATINDIETDVRTFLTYFDSQRIQMRLQYTKAEYTDTGKLLDGSITPHVDFGGESHTDFSEWLNEARLSCLALCMHLASVKKRNVAPTAGFDPLRILCLDDVLIGLDMGNRRHVLKVLKEHYTDFQIFLTTYDRHWFEVAKKELGDDWLKAELYESEDNQGHFRPLLITPSLSDYEHARFYFELKDYAACANYLRKVCEAEICRILPAWRRRNATDSGELFYVNNLQDLHSRLLQFLQQNGINPAPYKILDVIKATILNPFSHANMDSPIYRGELLETFDFINSLRKFMTTVIVKAEVELTVKKKSNDGNDWVYTVQLKEPLHILGVEGTLKFTHCEARPRSLFKDGVIHTLEEKDERLDTLYAHFCHFCNVPSGSLFDDFKLTDGKSLTDTAKYKLGVTTL
jgi:energy-coupling factor transporter ATP-binding protein EcfA2